jgi:hypothetical protein
VIALVTAAITASVVTIFTAVEWDRLNAKQQKADTVAKLGSMASKEISNWQQELIRLRAEVVGSLDNYYGNINTIQHVLLVCDVADRQVGVMESAMQAAMGGHRAQQREGRIENKQGRQRRRTGTGGQASVGLLADGDIVCGGNGRIQHTGTCTAD